MLTAAQSVKAIQLIKAAVLDRAVQVYSEKRVGYRRIKWWGLSDADMGRVIKTLVQNKIEFDHHPDWRAASISIKVPTSITVRGVR